MKYYLRAINIYDFFFTFYSSLIYHTVSQHEILVLSAHAEKPTTLNTYVDSFWFGLVCCFTPQSTAMVMSGRSVHLTTLFPGQA